MKIVHLSVFEPFGTCESVHYGLPVRIDQDAHRGAAHSRLELDWADDRLVVRDLGTHEGVRVRIAGEMRAFDGRELTTASRELEFAIAGTWFRVVVEERRADAVVEATQAAVNDVLDACAIPDDACEQDAVLNVLAALGRGSLVVRGSLQAHQERTASERVAPQDDVLAVLMRWAQASMAAVSVIEDLLETAMRLRGQ